MPHFTPLVFLDTYPLLASLPAREGMFRATHDGERILALRGPKKDTEPAEEAWVRYQSYAKWPEAKIMLGQLKRIGDGLLGEIEFGRVFLEMLDAGACLPWAIGGESNYARVQSGFTGNITLPSAALNEKLRASAAKQGIPLIEGNIHSSDVFYRQPSDAKPTYWEKLRDEDGCLCVEMESFALFANAQVLGKNAACLLTISDSFVSPEITTAEQRQKSFTDMMKVALGAEY